MSNWPIIYLRCFLEQTIWKMDCEKDQADAGRQALKRALRYASRQGQAGSHILIVGKQPRFLPRFIDRHTHAKHADKKHGDRDEQEQRQHNHRLDVCTLEEVQRNTHQHGGDQEAPPGVPSAENDFVLMRIERVEMCASGCCDGFAHHLTERRERTRKYVTRG